MKEKVIMKLRRTKGEKTVEMEVEIKHYGITKEAVNRHLKVIDSVVDRWTKEDESK